MASQQPPKKKAKKETKREHLKRILFPNGTIRSSALVREILALKPVENCIHKQTATLRVCDARQIVRKRRRTSQRKCRRDR